MTFMVPGGLTLRRGGVRNLAWVAVAVSLLLAGSLGASDVALAERLYQQTRYEEALKALGKPAEGDARALFLAGQCYYRMGEFKKATEWLEKALEGEPSNSLYANWLGKAYGRRAETSSFFTAPGYATTARRHFERAVELDPGNLEAVGDLFEYYLEAPGLLGGGVDKAAALAERMRERDAAEYHYFRGRLAEKRGDPTEAERHYRESARLEPESAGRQLELARLYARAGRWEEAEQAFARAEALEPDRARAKFARASEYVRAGRQKGEARQLLEEYLAAELTPDDPPRSEARELLRKVGRS